MADADVLPYDYAHYGHEIISYLKTAESKPAAKYIDFTNALAAAQRFAAAGNSVRALQLGTGNTSHKLDASLRAAEAALINPAGLPTRTWYKHTIYAPGEYTGYAAVVIPGVNEALDAKDPARATAQLAVLTNALNHAAEVLESASH
jgi:N-acetylated-alpha-linked acidic dipeptidase